MIKSAKDIRLGVYMGRAKPHTKLHEKIFQQKDY